MKPTPRHGQAAFTLIELLAVITIIVILAALVVSGMGFVTERQAKEKAKVQIALISKAIEEFKLDTGNYPATPNTATGSGQSAILFNALFYDSDGDGQFASTTAGSGDLDQNVYLPGFDPVTGKQGWTTGIAGSTTKVTDPWGKEYRYRSSYSSAASGGAATPNSDTQNPDFDLWSSGKDGVSLPATASDKSNRDDIKNF